MPLPIVGSTLTLGATLVCYLLGASLSGAHLSLRRPVLLLLARLAAALGALLHMTAIGLRCAELHRAPFTTPAESLSLLAWVVVLTYLGVEAFWRRSTVGSAVAPFALGLSFVLLTAGAAIGGEGRTGAPNPLLSENAISLHIIATVGALALFALAFCCAVLYLVAHHILKSKAGLIWMKRLPPLRTVENAGFVLTAVGFPLLTLGILSGFARALSGGLAPGWQTDPKALLSYAVWGVYGAYLLARLGFNWPPVRTSYVLLAGLVLCLLLLAVPSTSHRFG